jgi:hypothetical protein
VGSSRQRQLRTVSIVPGLLHAAADSAGIASFNRRARACPNVPNADATAIGRLDRCAGSAHGLGAKCIDPSTEFASCGLLVALAALITSYIEMTTSLVVKKQRIEAPPTRAVNLTAAFDEAESFYTCWVRAIASCLH